MAINYETKEWKNYPDTSTPIMAEELNRMERGISSAVSGLNSLELSTETALITYIKRAIDCLYPHDYSPTKIEATVGEDFYTYSGDSWFMYDISDDVFDPETDGLFVWRNDTELIAKSLYSLSRVLKPDENVTTWATNTTKLDLQDGDKVEFLIYKNSAATVTAGESIGLKAGATTAVSGVATPVEDDEEDNDD